VRVKQHRKEAAPEGWIIDAEGNPTTNVDDFYGTPPGALLPFGGMAAQKGFGLSVVVDILSGALTGAGCTRQEGARVGNGVFITAINIASFVDLSDFNAEVNRFIADIKSAKRSPGVEAIRLPGERGGQEQGRRQREGIFIEESTWEQIQAVVRKYQEGP
jgi:uncharacterized oxidoreductase